MARWPIALSAAPTQATPILEGTGTVVLVTMVEIAPLGSNFRRRQVYRATNHSGLVDKIAVVPILQLWISCSETSFWLEARPERSLHAPIGAGVDRVQAKISKERLLISAFHMEAQLVMSFEILFLLKSFSMVDARILWCPTL